MKIVSRFLSVVLIHVSSFTLLAGGPKIILDTDMFSDIDDVAAMSVLHALADAGECEILGTFCSVRIESSTHQISRLGCPVGMTQLINNYYNRHDLPLGDPKTGGWTVAYCPTIMGPVFTNMVDRAKDRLDYPIGVVPPDAIAGYRRLLAAAADKSVRICSIGYLTNLANLLKSPADDISPLTGLELVAAKVKDWYAMCCKYPSGNETNIREDYTSAIYAFANWPTPVYVCPFEIGNNIFCGARVAALNDPKNPVSEVFYRCLPSYSQLTKGHASYDPATVLAAVRGYEEYYNVVRGTFEFNGPNDNFVASATGNHYVFTEKKPFAKIGKILDELMVRAPGSGEPVPDPPVFDEDTTHGGAVKVTAEGCRIENCHFENFKNAQEGGAIYVNGNSCTVSGCTITNCHAVGTNDKRLGGGIYVNYQNDATFVVTNTVLSGCTAFCGGGIWIYGHVVGNTWTDFHPRSDYALVSDCAFIRCQNSYTTPSNPRAGAVYGKCWLENSIFDACGGDDGTRCFCPAVSEGVYGVIRGCVFENHLVGAQGIVQRCENNAYAYRVEDCVFRNNAITLIGAGAAVDRCVFDGNAINGAFVFNNSLICLRNSLFVRNHQPMQLASFTVENCTFADNPAGGVENSSAPTYVNTVIAAGAYGQDVFPNGTSVSLNLDHSWLESRDGDPRFKDAPNGDWTLTSKSPLVDEGKTVAWMDGATDLNGRPRILAAFGGAAPLGIPDIGCYENTFAGTLMFLR